MSNCNEVTWVPLFDDDLIIKESYMNPNIDRNWIRVAYRHVERTILMPTLGKCLYDKLMEMVCLGDPGDCCYSDLLYHYILPVVVYSIQAELSQQTSLKLTNAGLVSDQDNDHYVRAQISEAKEKRKMDQTKADQYLLALTKYLECNKECFPELGCGESSCGCNGNLVSPNSTRSIPGVYTGPASRSAVKINNRCTHELL